MTFRPVYTSSQDLDEISRKLSSNSCTMEDIDHAMDILRQAGVKCSPEEAAAARKLINNR